jgi:hypothetical protein
LVNTADKVALQIFNHFFRAADLDLFSVKEEGCLVRCFFAISEPFIVINNNFKLYRAPSISIFVGDIFDLSTQLRSEQKCPAM